MAIADITLKALELLESRINPGKEREATAGYLRAIVIGNVAGSRMTLPFTLLAWEKDPRKNDNLPPSEMLNTEKAHTFTTIATVGEMIADKLPFTPSRLAPPEFIGRLLSGGLAGTIIAYRFREKPILGALLGGSAAGFGAVAAYHSRMWLDEHTPIPDPVWGAVEDVIATSLGILAVRKTIPL